MKKSSWSLMLLLNSISTSARKWERKDKFLALWWSSLDFLGFSLRTADLGSAQAWLTLLASCTAPDHRTNRLQRWIKRGFASYQSYTQEPFISSHRGSFKKWREGNPLASVPGQPCLSAVSETSDHFWLIATAHRSVWNKGKQAGVCAVTRADHLFILKASLLEPGVRTANPDCHCHPGPCVKGSWSQVSLLVELCGDRA